MPPIFFLRIEGLLTLIAATAAYHSLGAPWIVFAFAFFVPDLSLLGYLAGPKHGALVYNLAHTHATPLVIALTAWGMNSTAGLAAAAIWFAHIGFDRALGYGLKLPTGFSDTHLGRIGRAGRPAEIDRPS